MGRTFLGPRIDGVLVDGSAVEVPLDGWTYPSTVFVQPANGDSVKVEYRCGASGAWQPWPQGTAGVVTSFASDVLESPVSALQFTRTAGSGTTSKFGVL